MAIWSDLFLAKLAVDAEQQINQDLQALYFKFYLATVTGTMVYTLPSYVRGVLRVTWRGRKLDPVSWEEMTLLTPATVFVGPGDPGNVNSVVSRPLYYGMHPTNPYDIRLFPTPDETFSASGGDPFGPVVNEPRCAVSCWRTADTSYVDPTLVLPEYIDRRTRKSWILWKAFSAEGKGQNLTAATYYKAKYNFLVDQFRAINEGCFVSKKYAIDDGQLSINNFRYPRPFLPANFEREIF